MLMVKLRESTFRAYKGIRKRLLCFVYRTSLPAQRIRLLHRLNTSQLFHLDRVLRLVEELSSLKCRSEVMPHLQRKLEQDR
jgi:hypothetical protein